jgi:hypothetical protein
VTSPLGLAKWKVCHEIYSLEEFQDCGSFLVGGLVMLDDFELFERFDRLTGQIGRELVAKKGIF